MFVDQNILNIVARSSNMNDRERIDMMQLYSMWMLEAFVWAGAEYYITEEDTELKTSEDMVKFIDKMFEEITKEEKRNEKLIEKLHQAFDEINMQFIQHFLENAPPGDALYLKVYLASNIEDWKKTKQEWKSKKKSPKNNLNLTKTKPASIIPEVRSPRDSLNLLA